MNTPGTGPSLQRLGRYHLSECLGGGPTGEVFRAKVYGVAGMDREFAVKRFHSSLVADPRVAAALAVAARMYGALEHPRIARLHEFGEAGGHTFTATEYVPGLDLAQLIDQGKLSLGAAARLVVQIGRAVGYAHGRGLSHLGLSPTNVVCSNRGEIKVTDFGVLPPRLPSDPAQDESLRQRLCYLAPEQLEGVRTSPATDVYQLGTLAYELMLGRRPYQGRDNVDLAQQMLGMPIPETDLPKPYDKLLRRALARSPFERFPDAGAMADALEAALRSSPTPGTAAEAGEAVSSRLEMLREQREGQASGVLSFPVPAPPKAPKEEVLAQVASPPPAPSSRAPLAHTMLGTVPAIPGRPPSAAETVPYLDDLEADDGGFQSDEAPTLGGLSSDQAPTVVRPDLVEDNLSADMELGPAGTDPSVAPRDLLGGVASAYTTPDEAPTRIQAKPRAETQDKETVVGDEVAGGDDVFSLSVEHGSRGPRRLESTLGELGELEPSGIYEAPPGSAPAKSFAATGPSVPVIPAIPPIPAMPAASSTPAIPPVPDMPAMSAASSTPAIPPVPDMPAMSAASSTPIPPVPDMPSVPETIVGPDFSVEDDPYSFTNDQSELISIPEGAPESVPIPPLPSVDSGIGSRGHRMPAELLPAATTQDVTSSGKSMLLPAILGGAALAVGGFFGYRHLTAKDDSGETTAKVVARDAGIVIPAADPQPEPLDMDAALTVATRLSDAGVAVVEATTRDAAEGVVSVDAASVVTEPSIPPPAPGGRLRIQTVPPGAKVYLDGTMVGTTPVDLDASTDQHRLALLLAGHDLYTGEIKGTGQLNIELAEVTPPGGPAGIKVRCRHKNRYYVYVDNDPVGQLCPSERIGVSKGSHVVEIYDPLTDSRKAFSVDVLDTRLSVRIKVD